MAPHRRGVFNQPRGEDHGPARSARPRARRRPARHPHGPPDPGGPVAVGASARAHRAGCAAGLVVRQVRGQARDDGHQPARVLPAPRRRSGAARDRLRRLRRGHRRRLQRDVRHRALPVRCRRPVDPAGPRVRGPRRPGRPAGVRRRRGVPGRVGTAVRAAAQRGAADRRQPRRGGRPARGDGAARQPRLVRRPGRVPAQLLRVLGAARPPARRGGRRGAHPGPTRRRRRLGRVSIPQLFRRAAVPAVVAVGRRQPARRPDRRRAAVLLPRCPQAPGRREDHPLHGDAQLAGGRAGGQGHLLRRGRQPALHPVVVRRPRARARRAPPDPARADR